MAKCLGMLCTTDGQHLVIREPPGPVTFPTSVVVSTLQTSLSGERVCVKHADASVGKGTPRGRSSICEGLFHSHLLTMMILSRLAGKQCEHVFLTAQTSAHTRKYEVAHSACVANPPPPHTSPTPLHRCCGNCELPTENWGA